MKIIKFTVGDLPFHYPTCLPLKDKETFYKVHGDKEVSGLKNGTRSNLHKERADNIHKALCAQIKRFQDAEKEEKEALKPVKETVKAPTVKSATTKSK